LEGLGLHVLNAVYVRADCILAVGGDPLLHRGCAQPGVLPDHRHHRNIDLRKNVRRHRPNRGGAKKDDQCRQYIERVRKSQREADDAHAYPLWSAVPGFDAPGRGALISRAASRRRLGLWTIRLPIPAQRTLRCGRFLHHEAFLGIVVVIGCGMANHAIDAWRRTPRLENDFERTAYTRRPSLFPMTSCSNCEVASERLSR